ncbi:MAG: [FeFe] hydrogenase, group A [Eubacteriales bacterium]|nr:[FeFe] hydrogenase, group A [Eubacteriales bacterium]
MVSFTINGKKLHAPEGTTILEAAEKNNIPIPHLCYLKDINEIAACRMCIVEIEGTDRFQPACNTEVAEGMVINTNPPGVRHARKTNLRLILSQHNSNCTTCVRSNNCELQRLSYALNIHYQPYKVKPEKNKLESNRLDLSVPVVREASKCIKCMRCIQVCDKIQEMHIWDLVGTGSRTTVDVSYSRKLKDTDCTFCGQCVTHCPTGALTVRDDTVKVLRALEDPEITTIVQVAPAVRVAWAESFGLTKEQCTAGRLVGCLKAMGFDYVFDTNFGADLTIMEEGSEFIERFTHRNKHRWPMFTSCCPGWVSFVKSQYPSYLDCLSTAKSPQQMFGAIAKSYFAEKMGLDPHKLCVVSIMPCSAKKMERELHEMRDACGDPDVDVVLTTREMNRLFRSDLIVPEEVEEVPFDSPLGSSTGAAVIFGATGGVMDAALRSAYYLIEGKNPDADAFKAIRGNRPWKEAVFNVPKAGNVRIAVVSGLGNARRLMEAIDSGAVDYDFVEVMACPGGCSGGGGQPIHEGRECASDRGDMLWELDKASEIRFSHENPEIKALYRTYLKKPLGEKAHKLLHTEHRPKAAH